MPTTTLHSYLPGYEPELLQQMTEHGTVQEIPAQTTILRQGQYAKVLPVVLRGVVKVITGDGEKELLLYYIEAGQSCIMSFSAILSNEASRIQAVTEEDTLLLLLPSGLLPGWLNRFPRLNQLFYHLYTSRYNDLLETIHHLVFSRMDERLYVYLLEKAAVTKSHSLHLTHRQIAAELGTAREVVTRLMKKLEQEKRIRQAAGFIEITAAGDQYHR